MLPHYRTKARIGGFTLVELIVTVSVIATIAVLGIVYGNGYKASTNNAERLSDIDTLKLAADSYYRTKGDYPEPSGNRIYFDANGAYEHSATGSYGVTWPATSDLFWAEFLAEVPKDPETGNYYGYGKRKDGVAAYDFATVDRRTDGYYAHVRGNYDGSALPSLVREYNGPNFVEDGKTSHLPYNPYEMKITAKVASFSGSVKVVPAKSLTGELVEGDSLNVPAGGFAVLHVSDGTEARVGSATSPTELKLESLSVKDTKGFLTRVRLALNSGEVWTKAPKLREDRGDRSELEITSGTAVASVRWTIFGVTDTAAGTDFTLVVGKLKITSNSQPVTWSGIVDGTVAVDEGGVPEKVAVNWTPATNAVPAPEAAPKSSPWTVGSAGTKVKIKNLKRGSGSTSVTFDNDQGFNKVSVGYASVDPRYPIAWSSRTFNVEPTHTETFTDSILPSNKLLPYPAVQSGSTATAFARLPIRFENTGGLLLETEIVVPRTGDFDYDATSIPSGGEEDCAAWYGWFKSAGCQPKSLRALAKYDSFSGQGGSNGDLNLYDSVGNPLPIMENFLSAADMSGKPYLKNFGRSATAANGDGWAFRTAANGSKGIIMETSNRDDYLVYDLSRLGLNPQDYAISVGVLSSSLSRTYSVIEKESGSPSLDNERRAYLWSLPDGTALYYRTYGTGDDASKSALPNALVLEDASGSVKVTLPIPSSVTSLVLQNATVETRFTTVGGVKSAKISVYFEKSTSAPAADFQTTVSNVSSSAPATVYVGWTKPRIESGVEKYDFNWGGKKDCSNPAVEIIDSFKVSSFD